MAFLGLWLLARRNRRSREEPLPPPAPESKAKREQSEFLSAKCSECNKTLKTKADLAGKKVRCPGCGKAVLVPTTEP
jgi:ribosomal protein S27E